MLKFMKSGHRDMAAFIARVENWLGYGIVPFGGHRPNLATYLYAHDSYRHYLTLSNNISIIYLIFQLHFEEKIERVMVNNSKNNKTNMYVCITV